MHRHHRHLPLGAATHVADVLQLGCLLSWYEGYGEGAGTVLVCAYG